MNIFNANLEVTKATVQGGDYKYYRMSDYDWSWSE
jgi:hypothetical protein